MSKSKAPALKVERKDRLFEAWWKEFFAPYQYGSEEAASAKSFALSGWVAAIETIMERLPPKSPTPKSSRRAG